MASPIRRHWMEPGEVLEIQYTVNHTDAMTYRNTLRSRSRTMKARPSPTGHPDGRGHRRPADCHAGQERRCRRDARAWWRVQLHAHCQKHECRAGGDHRSLRRAVPNGRRLCYEWLDPGKVLAIEYPVTHTEAGTYDNDASITVMDNEFNEASASDDQTVTVTDVLPTIMVTKTADPTAVPETGGECDLHLHGQEHQREEPVTITCLTDTCTARWPVTPTARWVPSWRRVRAARSPSPSWVEGDFCGPDHVNVFTAKAMDNEGNEATDDRRCHGGLHQCPADHRGHQDR